MTGNAKVEEELDDLVYLINELPLEFRCQHCHYLLHRSDAVKETIAFIPI